MTPAAPAAAALDALFVERTVPTREGFPLAAFDHRPAEVHPARPTLVLVHGLGGNLITWRHLIAALAPHYRIVTWDYRGLYGSRFSAAVTPSAHRGEVALDVPAHVDDAVRVLDALNVTQAVFIGWSMGVQVSLEFTRPGGPMAARVAGLIEICGAAGRTLGTTALGRLGPVVIPTAMNLFRAVTARFAPSLAHLASSPNALNVAKSIGFAAPSLDDVLAQEIVAAYMQQDFAVYNRILLGLMDHDATSLLSQITAPSLFVAGTRDLMTPPSLSEAMARAVSQAELHVIEGASHYLPVEFPLELETEVTRFLGAHFP